MLRKITSLTSFLALIITLVTSVILYIVPQGRVAYWADWHLMGLSKEQWGDIHITVGTLFLVMLFIHLWLNWKPITAYMKNQAREMVVMTKPMIISVALTAFVTVGTLLGLPPMQQLIDLGASIKDGAVATYGNPPYGHAELSPLKKFCGFLGFDAEKALAALQQKGYGPDISLQTPVKEIAASKGVSPQQVLDDIRVALGESMDPFAAMPATPPEGTGKLALADICKTFGLPLQEAVAKLNTQSIKADGAWTMKKIANENGMNPKEVYDALRATP
ncbi:conserved membrane protein of unknown function [Pseudodesulfovibrio profundus]|uniref:Flavinylation-associated cytochrome domain-containing protein n=1 Tax=Pseudodesulfovibrio profundus TaxID=57320 RepID=A0A2C8FAA4_9BACT|nr:DUF4405 domain-containing protein [Pseudodesulfovibrio profundus]MBC15816.1 hypothetical protein [Desulfovibrio sp.]SOB59575.1 conserved membrane protein of unknown function [Pseudodesulfovibrio profundus]|tara:strand:- start:873 stop:1700 length:828 start_codon:yes stop_codon:yes gene_type:complete